MTTAMYRSRVSVAAGVLMLLAALVTPLFGVDLGSLGARVGLNAYTGVSDLILDDPAAIQFQGKTHVFGRHNPESYLYHRFDLDKIDTNENLGGTLTFGPAVASWGTNRLDVFYRGQDGALYQKYFDGQWRGHVKLTADNVIHSHPTAVSWGPNRIDVFARGASGGIVQIYWDGTAWRQHDGLSLAVPMYHGLGVSSRGVGKLDLFYRGNDNALRHRSYDAAAGGWGSWVTVGGSLTSDPRAVSPRSNRIDVVARGANQALTHYVWENGSWVTVAETLQGSVALGSGPTIAVSADGPVGGIALEVLARRATDGALVWLPYNVTTTGWGAWEKVPLTFRAGVDQVTDDRHH
jgi:hypothetical protein